VKVTPVAIIGAGPYGLSIAAHLAERGIENRIFGQPMSFWSNIAAAGSRRYLKSYCFGTNLSAPGAGYSFADYNEPRGLETFEPCSIGNFADYGQWFQQHNVPWCESIDVRHIAPERSGFRLTLANGEQVLASQVVLATGLTGFANVPDVLAALPPKLCSHTSEVMSFSAYAGLDVAVVGAGQSALEAAALLHEAGARPQVLIREDQVYWHQRVMRERSLWRRLRSPITGLGTGPKAWALTRFPGAMHRVPENLRTRFVRSHLSAEGAWWLRERVEGIVPMRLSNTVIGARECDGRVELQLRATLSGRVEALKVDRVIAGSGYLVDVDRMTVLDGSLRAGIRRIGQTPRLDSTFQTTVPALRIVGPATAMSFGPLFRFVVGAEFTALTIAGCLSDNMKAAASWALAAR
jgi:cation diffusion facilitator CzcD-associated flavoprotein CzcO